MQTRKKKYGHEIHPGFTQLLKKYDLDEKVILFSRNSVGYLVQQIVCNFDVNLREHLPKRLLQFFNIINKNIIVNKREIEKTIYSCFGAGQRIRNSEIVQKLKNTLNSDLNFYDYDQRKWLNVTIAIHNILSDLDRKLFCFAPICGNGLKYAFFCKQAIFEILYAVKKHKMPNMPNGLNVAAYKDIYIHAPHTVWPFLFKMNKLNRFPNKRFKFYIGTDGYGLSVSYEQVLNKLDNQNHPNCRIENIKEDDEFEFVAGDDPGMRTLSTIANRFTKRIVTIKKRKFHFQRYLKKTEKQCKRLRTDLQNERTQYALTRNVKNDKFNYANFTEYRMKFFRVAFKAYGPQYSKLRFQKYQDAQRALTKNGEKIGDFVRKKNGKKRRFKCRLYRGKWRQGRPSVKFGFNAPFQPIEKFFQRTFNVWKTDERNTSKIVHCHRVPGNLFNKKRSIKCPKCKTIADRDA